MLSEKKKKMIKGRTIFIYLFFFCRFAEVRSSVAGRAEEKKSQLPFIKVSNINMKHFIAKLHLSSNIYLIPSNTTTGISSLCKNNVLPFFYPRIKTF